MFQTNKQTDINESNSELRTNGIVFFKSCKCTWRPEFFAYYNYYEVVTITAGRSTNCNFKKYRLRIKQTDTRNL